MAEAPLTVEDVKRAYTNGEINARTYHAKLYQMSRVTFQDRIAEASGPIGRLMVLRDQMYDDFQARAKELEASEGGRKEMQAALAEMKRTGQMPERLFSTPESFIDRLHNDFTGYMKGFKRIGEFSGNGYKMLFRGMGAPDWMGNLASWAAETGADFLLTGRGFGETQQLGATAAVKGTKLASQFLSKVPIGSKIAEEGGAAATALTGAQSALGEVQLPAKDIAEGISSAAKYDSPLANKLADFAKESAEQARGTKPVIGGERAGQLRRSPHQETLLRAMKLPKLTLEDVGRLPAGTTLKAEEVIQHQEPFQEPIAELLDLAPRVIAGDEEAGLAFDMLFERSINPIKAIEGTKTEAGRATEILRATQPVHEQIARIHDIYAGMSPELAANGDWNAARRTLATRLMELGSGQDIHDAYATAARNLEGVVDGKARGDLFREGFIAQYLLKPASWVKKTLGDVTGGIDKSIQYSLGYHMSADDKTGLLKSDAIMAHKAMLMSFLHTMGVSTEAAGALTKGVKAEDAVTALKAVGVKSSEAHGLAGFFDYGGDPENWNIPAKAFNTITGKAQNTGMLFGQYMNAMRQATREGLEVSSDAWVNRATELMGTIRKDALTEGISAGGEMTYTNPLGPLASQIRGVLQNDTYKGWLVTPFAHVPMNMVNRALSNIPVVSLFTNGMAKALAGESGDVQRDLALGRLAIAQMSSQMFWLMRKGGMLTDNGPLDRKERDALFATGWKPNSFHYGNHYIPLAFLGPLGIQASIVANAAGIADYFDQPGLETLAGSMTIASAHAIAHEPWFDAWGRFASEMENPERGGIEGLGAGLVKLATSPLAAAVPALVGASIGGTAGVVTGAALSIATAGSPVIGTIARELDPFFKSVDNVLDDLKQNSPFFRYTVPNRLNPLTGQPERLPTPFGLGWLRDSGSPMSKVARIVMAELNPVSEYSVPTTDPVVKEMNRVGAVFPNYKMNQGTRGPMAGAAPEPGQSPPVNLTAAESAQLIKRGAERKYDGDQTIHDYLQEMISDPDWHISVDDGGDPISVKKHRMEAALRANNKQAFDEILPQNPDIALRYSDSKLHKKLQQLPAEERDQFMQDFLQRQNESLQETIDQQQMQLNDRDMDTPASTQTPGPTQEEPTGESPP